MYIDLTPYKDKRICVAVSGGKDSMALLHYIKAHGAKYGITLSALNCDHGIRGEESARDSAFVGEYCALNAITLHTFKWEGRKFADEGAARWWRLCCYNKVITQGNADLVATAHHMNDNAETVLFNLARGASLSGLTGITDAPALGLIRPMAGCLREEIDGYIKENNIPFVTDSTNLTDGYTRNKIRHNVLPALEEAVPGAVKNIYRFSRLAAEDEEYFGRKADELITVRGGGVYLIKPCAERVIFKRAAHKIVAGLFNKKDYTAAHFGQLFALQEAQNGKKFAFLGLIAIKEEGGVAICDEYYFKTEAEGMPFYDNMNCDQVNTYCGVIAAADYAENLSDVLLSLDGETGQDLKVLKFDADKIPATAVIRFKRRGDKFTKFGGGTKSLGDYLTDKKIPQSLRPVLPLVCDNNDVLIVGGVEISDGVAITSETKRTGIFVCTDPLK